MPINHPEDVHRHSGAIPDIATLQTSPASPLWARLSSQPQVVPGNTTSGLSKGHPTQLCNKQIRRNLLTQRPKDVGMSDHRN